MQSLRFRKGLGDETGRDDEVRPSVPLVVGMCLLVAAAVVIGVLAAVRFGVLDAAKSLLQ